MKEINCSVLGDEIEAIASECEEPMHTDEILSYEDKYISNAKGGNAKGMASVLRKIPAEISKEEREKVRELAEIENCIDVLIEEKGYTTKQEVYDNLGLEDNEIDKVFRIFKSRLWENRTYKAPTKQDREKYGLESGSWIIQNK